MFKYQSYICLLYTSDAADEEDSVDLGGRRIIKKKKKVRRRSVDIVRRSKIRQDHVEEQRNESRKLKSVLCDNVR